MKIATGELAQHRSYNAILPKLITMFSNEEEMNKGCVVNFQEFWKAKRDEVSFTVLLHRLPARLPTI